MPKGILPNEAYSPNIILKVLQEDTNKNKSN